MGKINIGAKDFAEQVDKLYTLASQLGNYRVYQSEADIIQNTVVRDFGEWLEGKRKQVTRSDLEKFYRRQERLGIIRDNVQKTPEYQQLLRAFFENNQAQLAQLLPQIFSGICVISGVGTLYHGVTAPLCQLVEQPKQTSTLLYSYVDKVQDIQRQGVLPSEGIHYGLDEQVRAVFCVDDPDDTFGLLYFAFQPEQQGITVVQAGHCDGNEHMLFTPRLTIPRTLWLKGEERIVRTTRYIRSYQTDDVTADQLLAFRSEIKTILDENGVSYEVEA